MKNWKYRRYFEKPAGQIDPSFDDLEYLYCRLGLIKHVGSSVLPAAYTYFGQFISHDLTLLVPPSLANTRHSVESLIVGRTPTLDLDSMYGSGLDDSGALYDPSNGTFIMGMDSRRRFRDFPRQADGSPMIADRRNDENLLLAQMQILFMNFHNRVIAALRDESGDSEVSLFDAARREVTQVYQYLVLHDFARRILPAKVYELIIKNQDERCLLRPLAERRDSIAIEFSVAAFRMHSLVRSGYKLNKDTETITVSLSDMFRFTGRGHASGSPPNILPWDKVIDWQFFLERNVAAPLTMKVEKFGSSTLSRLTIERGLQLGLASGQSVFTELEKHEAAGKLGLTPVDIGNSTIARLRGSSVLKSTPLWLYLMLESVAKSYRYPATFDEPDPEKGNFGIETRHQFGVMGGWLVADTLLAAAKAAGYDDTWDPRTSRIYDKTSGRPFITLEDVVKFTYPPEQQESGDSDVISMATV